MILLSRRYREDINSITLTGRIVAEPETKYLQNETGITTFRLAWNNIKKSTEGYTDKSCFIDCVCFNKTGERAAKFLSKGSFVIVTGELDFEEWDKDGQKRSKHKIVVYAFHPGPKQKEGVPF